MNQTDLSAHILDATRHVVTDNAPLHAPEIAGNEWIYVKECLDTAWVSTVGAYVTKFEDMLRDITGAAHVIATDTGTSALHTCLMLAGVGQDDEVIIPSLTFVATANAVAYCGAIPHFADVEERTLGIDPAKLGAHLAETTERTTNGLRNKETGRIVRAVVCMHTFGHPVALDELLTVCEKYGVQLIEDAAESLGSFYKERHTGTFGALAAISFNGNKIVTSGGGGAILTNNDEFAARAKHITTTAKTPHPWEFNHDEIGYNYRLTNVAAAIGCAQLERLGNFINRKRQLAEKYAQAFSGVENVRFVTEPEDCASNYWLNVLILDTDVQAQRDDVLKTLNDAGLMSRAAWTPMHWLPMFTDAPGMDLSVTESLFARLINIPSSPILVGP